ncbi:hypothetical protein J1N35_027982 [Gossypium stocksii]|uniref:Uncharacterized protein n=1 Tax=Gossypium stocksii TaxID=47602 RepID=A0A9D3VBC7_9ROSI|nr:hypothetical protein J1N35_027982 [Gossypium stocksii]
MGFQSKESSLQAENTVDDDDDDDDVMEESEGQAFSAEESDQRGRREGKAREAKRIAKEVQAEKLKERAKQKKQEIEAVKKWRKQRQQNGFCDGKRVYRTWVLKTANHSRGQERKDQGCLRGIDPEVRQSKAVKRAIIRKQNREFWNSKFGFRGRIGLKKQNTAETTNDLKGFNNGSIAGPAATNRPASPPPRTRPSGPAKEILIPPDLLFVPPLLVGIYEPDSERISKCPWTK